MAWPGYAQAQAQEAAVQVSWRGCVQSSGLGIPGGGACVVAAAACDCAWQDMAGDIASAVVAKVGGMRVDAATGATAFTTRARLSSRRDSNGQSDMPLL